MSSPGDASCDLQGHDEPKKNWLLGAYIRQALDLNQSIVFSLLQVTESLLSKEPGLCARTNFCARISPSHSLTITMTTSLIIFLTFLSTKSQNWRCQLCKPYPFSVWIWSSLILFSGQSSIHFFWRGKRSFIRWWFLSLCAKRQVMLGHNNVWTISISYSFQLIKLVYTVCTRRAEFGSVQTLLHIYI